MNAMVRVKRFKENCKTLNVSCTCFNLCILVKVKEIIKCFFRKDLTSFFMLLHTFDFLLAYLLIVMSVDLGLLKI